MEYTDLTMVQIIDTFTHARYNKEQTKIKYMLFYRQVWHRRQANIYYLIETDTYLVVSEKIESNVIHLALPEKEVCLMEE